MLLSSSVNVDFFVFCSCEERAYNTVDHGNNGYEIPRGQTTHTEYEMIAP